MIESWIKDRLKARGIDCRVEHWGQGTNIFIKEPKENLGRTWPLVCEILGKSAQGDAGRDVTDEWTLLEFEGLEGIVYPSTHCLACGKSITLDGPDVPGVLVRHLCMPCEHEYFFKISVDTGDGFFHVWVPMRKEDPTHVGKSLIIHGAVEMAEELHKRLYITLGDQVVARWDDGWSYRGQVGF